MKGTLAIFTSIVLTLAFAGPGFSAEEKTPALTDIQVSFKLDPRITQGLYMGERWVSPATYTGTSAQDTVEARVQGTDAKGRPVSISPKWIPADPEMVTVSPSQGSQVKITVKRAGESRLQVTSQGVSKELSVKAAVRNNVLQVEIAQSAVVRPPTPAQAVPALHSPAVPPAQDAPKLNSDKERLSYALGMNLGSAIRRESVEADLDSLIQGIKDALSASQTSLTEQEMRATLITFQGELKKKKTALQATRKNELSEKNKKDGEAFLAENKAKEGVVTLVSGLQYKVLKAGDGRIPTMNDTVVVHYRGTLVDGTEISSSHKRNGPASLPVKKVIKGWREALQRMPVGSTWQLFIPSHLAYGDGAPERKRGRNAPNATRARVAPNATLIFEVELISIRDNSGADAQVSENIEDKGPDQQASAQ